MANESRITELIFRLKDEVSKNATPIQRSLQGLEQQIKSFLGLVGLGVGVATVIQFGRSMLNVADQIGDLAERSGVSIGVLAGMRPILAETGVSIEEFATGVTRMMRSLVESTEGTNQQRQALQKLGFSTEEVLKFMSDPDGFLEAFAKRLAAIPTHAERVAIAQDLASRAGAKLAPVLLRIAEEGLPRVSKETEEAIKVLGNFTDWLARASAEALNFWASLLGGAGRSLGFGKSLADQLRDEIEGIQDTLARVGRFPGLAHELPQTPEELKKRLEALRQLLAKVEEGEKRAKATVAPRIGADPEIQKKLLEIEKQITSVRQQGLDPLSQLLVKEAELRKVIQESKLSQEDRLRLLEETARAFGHLRDKLLTDAEQKSIEKLFGDIKEAPEVDIGWTFTPQQQAEVEFAIAEARGKSIDLQNRIEEAFNQISQRSQQTFSDMSEFARQAQRNIQDAFADFFDSFTSRTRSAKEIFADFLNSMRHSVNQLLAQQLGEAIFGHPELTRVTVGPGGEVQTSKVKGPSWFDVGLASLGSFVRSIFGFQQGGMVPGPIGRPQLAVVHGGETVTPAGGGSMNVFIDARGAERGVSLEIMKAIRMAEDRAIIRSINQVREEKVRGGAFGKAFR